MANIIPSTESIVNTLMPNVKFALGPLMIKRKRILIITVNIDKTPKIFLLLSKTKNHLTSKSSFNIIVVFSNILYRNSILFRHSASSTTASVNEVN